MKLNYIPTITALIISISLLFNAINDYKQKTTIKKLEKRIEQLERRKPIDNRTQLILGKYEEPVSIECEVTAYTNDYESTQKHKGEKGYGITKSGLPTKENHTVAADLSVFPLGTKLQIEGLEGVFVVEDTGGKIKGNKIDVFFENVNNAIAFGKRKLNITVVE